MLSQAGFPREEADVEICRQKSVWAGGGLGMDRSGEQRKEADRGEVGCHRTWPAPGSQGALELEGSSGLSQFAERGPGPWTPLHTERFRLLLWEEGI